MIQHQTSLFFSFFFNSLLRVMYVQGHKNNTKRQNCRKKKMLWTRKKIAQCEKDFQIDICLYIKNVSDCIDVWLVGSSIHREMNKNQIDKPDLLNKKRDIGRKLLDRGEASR